MNNMDKRLIYCVGLIAGIFVTEVVQAAKPAANLIRLEQRKYSESEPHITTMGVFGQEANKYTHIDLTYLESKTAGDTWGLDVGVGYTLPTSIKFFVGIGVLLGYNTDKEDYLTAYYPEVGAILQINEAFALSASRKRYFDLYNKTEDATLFGIIFSFQ
jgi:hypothetical protein